MFLKLLRMMPKGEVKCSTINYGKADLIKTFNYGRKKLKGTDTTIYLMHESQCYCSSYQRSIVNSYLLRYSSGDNACSVVNDRVFDNGGYSNFKPEKCCFRTKLRHHW